MRTPKEPNVEEMAAMIVRLARALKKAQPDNTLSQASLNYLDRMGIRPSPLREARSEALLDTNVTGPSSPTHSSKRVDHLIERVTDLRRRLAPHFASDTAYPGTVSAVPSAGHCAIVAAITSLTLGGQIVSTKVEGQSHWFNRFLIDGGALEVDLTGDQFGYAAVQCAYHPLALYPEPAEHRTLSALSDEAVARTRLLAQRAQMPEVVEQLDALLLARSAPQNNGVRPSKPSL